MGKPTAEATYGAVWFQQELARLHARVDALEAIARGSAP